MENISELEKLLLTTEHEPFFAAGGHGLRIVVFRQFRFHNALCIELYDAATTKEGRIKNPLTYVSAFDAALTNANSDALLFYNAVSRFQFHQASGKKAADIRALKMIFKNPLSLRFFYHDPEFSENVSAGSLKEVQPAGVLKDFSLVVTKADSHYQFTPQVRVGEASLHPRQLQWMFDFFILHQQQFYLLASPTLVRLMKYFSTRDALRVHEQQFDAFNNQVLAKLEEQIEIIHSYIRPATEAQLLESGLAGSMERLIYLSDLGQYVVINPVMRYGPTEVPLRSKKMVYLADARGRPMTIQRDAAAEDSFLGFLLRQHPLFFEQLEDGLPYFYLHRDRFLDEEWFLQAFDEWRQAGISIFGFNQLKGNKLNANRASISVQVQTGLNWFNTQLKVSFGKQTASLKQLQQAARNKSRFVQLDDGTLGILPYAWIERMAKFFLAAEIVGEDLITPRAHFDLITELYEEAELDGEVKASIQTYRHKLSNVEEIQPAAAPKGLLTHLRNYQLEGLAWLNMLDEYQFGGVLADDMGLGKTVQIISFLLLLKQKGRTDTNLIVVPTTLLFNWQAEIKRFAPSLKVHLLHGAKRTKELSGFDSSYLVLTSYGTLISDISHLRKYRFGYVFLDESQQIKNVTSQRYHAVRLLQSSNRIAITGTPIENNTFDLYAQLSFVNPGLLGNTQYFRDVYSTPIDKFEDNRRAAELRRKVELFILRRTKETVAQELPDKTEQVLYCPMGEEQRNVYTAYEQELRDYLEDKIQDSVLRNSIHVLRGLTQLRQICDDPRLLKSDYLPGHGSSKIEALMEQIESKSGQHKILVFSQFVSMLNLLRDELDKAGISYAYLTGATKKREEVVDRFQNDSTVRVFLLSLKVGGMGLNLTAANYVYLVDPWWNPAVEAQAIDRAYRIGQHSNVQAIRLICPDTVEEKIMLLQESKKARFAELVQSATGGVSSFTSQEWREILGG